HLVHGIAKGLGYDLYENGVAVIDFQNCGNPEIFAVLSRAFHYPWLIVVDQMVVRLPLDQEPPSREKDLTENESCEGLQLVE
ncbi:hypothetical protein ACC724_39235, partial [Rhizobium ruizarguesonis]